MAFRSAAQRRAMFARIKQTNFPVIVLRQKVNKNLVGIQDFGSGNTAIIKKIRLTKSQTIKSEKQFDKLRNESRGIKIKKIKISTKRKIGFKSADIGKGGKEFNVKITRGFKEADFNKKRVIIAGAKGTLFKREGLFLADKDKKLRLIRK